MSTAINTQKTNLEPRKKLEIDCYDRHSQYYTPSSRYGAESIPHPFKAPYYYAKNFFLNENATGKTALECGCGRGNFSIFLSKIGLKVTGVDISPASIKKAKSFADFHNVNQTCSFVEGDCEKLEYSPQSFDYVVSIGILPCLNWDAALKEMARVVKAQGTVVMIDTLGDNPLLNLNRKIKFLKGKRTKNHVKQILKLEDLNRFKRYFNRVEIKLFDLTTLGLFPFKYKESTLLDRAANGLARLDQKLLQIKPLQNLAFKFVALLSDPRR